MIQAITTATWQHMLHIPTIKVLIYYILTDKTNKKTRSRAPQKSLPFGKWRFRENEVRSRKAEKDKTERATGLGR